MYKKFKLVIPLICVIIALTASCSVPPGSSVPGGGNIEVITSERDAGCWSAGDSIVAGTGTYDYGIGMYMPDTTRMVALHGTPIIEFETDGGKSIRTQLMNSVRAFGYPDCVIIHAGGWDLINRAKNNIKELGTYQDEIQRINIWLTINGVQVFWVQVVPLLYQGPVWSQQGFRQSLNSWEAESFGEMSINCSDAVTGNQFDYVTNFLKFLPDWSHPTNPTAADMARCVTEKVREVREEEMELVDLIE